MADKVRKPRSKETISYTMSRIRGKDTGIEMLLRKELTKRGYHYRCNTKHVFGHPDVSFKSAKVVVFCDSEFWHGYHFEENKGKLHTNLDYWIPKIEHNIERDKEVNARLKREGYTVLRYWGEEINKDLDRVIKEVTEVVDKKMAIESLRNGEKELTTLIYLEQNEKYLMLLRNKKKNDENANKYIGVGGHLEDGETPLECVKREVLEETGLTVNKATYKGFVDFCKVGRTSVERMYLYTCSDFSGDLIQCNEGTLEWVPVNKINELPLWEGDRVFLPLLKEDDKPFHITLVYSESDELIDVYGPSYEETTKRKKKKKKATKKPA